MAAIAVVNEVWTTIHLRKMSDWSTRDHVTLPNSKWRQYLHRLWVCGLQMHIRIFLEQPRLFIILFHLFLWDPFPAMLAFWPVYRIQLWTCLSDHSPRSRRTTIFLIKAGSLERTPFVTAQCSGEIRHYGSFEIPQTPGSSCIFFTEKVKAKLCFLQQDFYFI